MDVTQPIDIYFQTIDDCVQFATDGQVPFTPTQVVQTAYHVVSRSGIYNEACKEWRRKPLADQTWTHFKAFFATEYNELKEQQKLNTNQNNFHGANSAIDLTTAIDSLAMAATSDRDVMTQLTSTNKQLVQTINQLTEQLGKAQAELAQAKQQQVPKPKSNTNNKPAPHHGARPKFDHAA
jgi:DNA anti-recombination protein RmuC